LAKLVFGRGDWRRGFLRNDRQGCLSHVGRLAKCVFRRGNWRRGWFRNDRPGGLSHIGLAHGLAQLQQESEGAGKLAVEAGIVAIEEIEGAGPIAEAAKSQSGAGAWFRSRGSMLVHFDLHGGFLNRQEAHQAPARDRHVFDQGALDFVLRSEVALEDADEIGENLRIFVIEDDDLGEHAMTQAVGRGTSLRFGCFGAGGLGAVGARGADSTFGTHTT
jgi:hypothetical protein